MFFGDSPMEQNVNGVVVAVLLQSCFSSFRILSKCILNQTPQLFYDLLSVFMLGNFSSLEKSHAVSNVKENTNNKKCI